MGLSIKSKVPVPQFKEEVKGTEGKTSVVHGRRYRLIETLSKRLNQFLNSIYATISNLFAFAFESKGHTGKTIERAVTKVQEQTPAPAASSPASEALDKVEGKKNKKGVGKKSPKEKFHSAVKHAKHLYKGVQGGAKAMDEYYHSEYLDKEKRYGRAMVTFLNFWKASQSTDGFNEWMEHFEKGDISHLGLSEIQLTDMQKEKVIGQDFKLLPISKVTYLNDEERKAYRVKINKKEQFFYTENEGKLLNTKDEHHPHIFVIAPDESIYSGVYKKGTMNHSSFLSGAPVLAAGELYFKEGKLQTITDKSGHYQPTKEMMAKGLKILQKRGIDLSEVKLILNSHPLSTGGPRKEVNALEFLKEALQAVQGDNTQV